MFLNQIQEPRHTSLFVDRFDGLCDEVVASQHKWRNMLNMSGEAYPSIGTRKPYTVLCRVPEETQLFVHDRLFSLREGRLYEADRAVAELGGGRRCGVSMGEDLILMPDKKIYNSALGKLRDMERSFRARGIRFGIANEYGEAYEGYVVSDQEPQNKALWLDSREKKLKRWQNGVYESLQGLYLCLEAAGIEQGFAVGDAVSLSGIREFPLLNRSYIIEGLFPGKMILAGYLERWFQEAGEVEISRSVPLLDSMAVWNNRLWGINRQKRELYASKLGSPEVFQAFSGLSGDSCLFPLEEEPLQIAALEEELIVLCEHSVYRVTGTRPANFRCTRLAQPGIRRGSEGSLALLQDCLYYVSAQGVIRYDGVFRRINRRALTRLGDCIGFAQGGRYYLCQQSGAEQGIFVYDTEHDFWHREADYAVSAAVSTEDTAYLVCSNKLLAIGRPDPSLQDRSIEQEGELYWFAETADFSLTLPDKRTMDTIQVMLNGKGDYAVFAAYDVDPEETDNSRIPWEMVDADVFRGELGARVPVCARPCHTMRLRISGNGSATIYSILRSIYELYED